MYTYAVPAVSSVVYTDLAVANELHAEVVHTSQLRASVERCVRECAEPLVLVQAMSEYLPYLLALHESILHDKVFLRDELHVKWTSMITPGPKFQLHGMLSEVYMMHVLYAAALRANAATIVDALGTYGQEAAQDPAREGRLKVATDLLCRASGVCEYVLTQLLPACAPPPLPSAYPPEMRSEGILASAKLAMADAHALAIRKLQAPFGIAPGTPLPPHHPSPSLLAKLHLHTSTLYRDAHTLMLRALGMDAPKHKLVQKLHTLRPDEDTKMAFPAYANKHALAHRARAFLWLGIERGETAHSIGWAIAYLGMAEHIMADVRDKKAKSTALELAHIRQWLATYKKTNDTVRCATYLHRYRSSTFHPHKRCSCTRRRGARQCTPRRMCPCTRSGPSRVCSAQRTPAPGRITSERTSAAGVPGECAAHAQARRRCASSGGTGQYAD